jgi:anaerobic selenocysteine-containing dehydrogenase
MASALRVRGACPHDCPDTCGIVTEVENGRAVGFAADPENPITRGWLCAKVRPYLNHVYHPDRVLYPLKRSGPKGSGQWQRISWKAAIETIAERWQELIRHAGPEAILPYSYSGTLGLVQMTVSSARFWNRLGVSQLQRSICGAAAEMAVEATLGARWSQPYEDVAKSRLVILWGHNPVATAPHFMPYLRQAQHAGCRVVVIDPRRTASAVTANQHLAPIPGTDGVLALALAHVIVEERKHDDAWLHAHTVGWPELRQRLADFAPQQAAEITGLAAAEIVELARLYVSSRPALIKISDGINRNPNGGQNVRAICALPAITGQYGVPGGGLSYSTSGYLKWDQQAVHHWQNCRRPGRIVNMNRLGAALLGEASNPRIGSLYVFGANPATSSPNAASIVEGLRRPDLFTVVHDLFLTDTADWADIVLPATSQLEHVDLHKAYGHTFLTYNRPAIAPRGEARSNWEVMGLLANAMGFDEPWLHQNPDEVIAEVLQATARTNPALAEVTLERLKNDGAVPLKLAGPTPFADGHFPTPSGKVELYSQGLAATGIDPLPGRFQPPDQGTGAGPIPAGGLWLLTGASHHFVSSSFASQEDLLKGEGTPFLEIHPDDAARRDILNGDQVVVENGRGQCQLRAVVTNAVRPGVVVSPKGRWSKLGGGRNVNWTTSDRLGDMAGQSTFHSNRVWVSLATAQVEQASR